VKKLEVRIPRNPEASLRVGTLAQDRGRVFFEYAPEFLETGWNLSPICLPFAHGLFEHTDRDFGPLPGLFDDSLPDGWGLLLMDRHLRSRGLDPAGVGPLDRLSWLGTQTMGALTYHPPSEREEVDSSVFDLHELSRQSQALLSGTARDVLPQLLRAGGSPGGARPKVLVGFHPRTGQIISGEDDLPHGFQHWLVKFISKTDFRDAGAIEYAYSLMATAAGIDMPPTRLFETSEGDLFFGTRRFDRSENRRIHVHTFGNLIQANFRIPSVDYADLQKTVWVLTQEHGDLARVFRRMVFNVKTHNRDDHAKNFAFVLLEASGRWTLGPAYDLMYAPGPGGEHSMSLAGEGRNPDRPHLLRLAAEAGLSDREAVTIIEEVEGSAARWKTFASEAGVSRGSARKVEAAFPKFAK
jgi:serine/threonine-protein kinase HipA